LTRYVINAFGAHCVITTVTSHGALRHFRSAGEKPPEPSMVRRTPSAPEIENMIKDMKGPESKVNDGQSHMDFMDPYSTPGSERLCLLEDWYKIITIMIPVIIICSKP